MKYIMTTIRTMKMIGLPKSGCGPAGGVWPAGGAACARISFR